MPNEINATKDDLLPSQVADRVADMVRRAVLRELESSSESNQMRVVVLRPLEDNDLDGVSYDDHKIKVRRCTAIIVNAPKEDSPVIVTSQQSFVPSILPDEGDERKRFLRALDYRTVMGALEKVAEKVYGLK